MPCWGTPLKTKAAAWISPLSPGRPLSFLGVLIPEYQGPLGVGQGACVHGAMNPPEAGAGGKALRSSRVSSLLLTCSAGTAQRVHPQLWVHMWHPA